MNYLQRNNRFFLLLLLFLCIVKSGSAQVYPFKTYTVRDGLLTNVVMAITQDVTGRLWLGHGDGINIFDGTAFRRITVQDGLPGGYINLIHPSVFTAGKMYVGSRKGIAFYYQSEWNNIEYGDSINEKDVFSLYEASAKSFYFGTRSGLFICENGVVKKFSATYKMGLVSSIIPVEGGKEFLLSATEGVFLFESESGAFKKIDISYDAARTQPELAITDSAGNIYVLFSDSRVVKLFNKRVIASEVLLRDRSFDMVYHNGYLWIATHNGVYKVPAEFPGQRDKIIRYGVEEGLPTGEIERLFFDAEGTLWIATRSDGVARFTPGEYVRFPQDQVNLHTIEDEENHIWGSVRNTLNEYYFSSTGEVKKQTHQLTGIGKETIILRFAMDTQDRLWVAFGSDFGKAYLACYKVTRNGENNPSQLSLLPYQLGNHTLFPEPAWLSMKVFDHYLVYSVLGDGVAIVDITGAPKLYGRLDKRNGLTDPAIRALGYDKKGQLWLGGWERGLFSVDLQSTSDKNVQVKQYLPGSGLSDYAIRSIYCDENNVLYIGTRTGGINRYENGIFSVLSFSNGLESNQIWSIKKLPGENRLIVGTQRGPAQSALNNYLLYSSLPDVAPSPVYECAVLRNKALYILDSKGVTIYPGKYASFPGKELRITVDAVSVNGEQRKAAPEYQLSFSENNIRIDFSVVSLSGTGIFYEFTMNEAETSWQSLGEQRYALLSALRHGDYVFSVRAIDINRRVLSDTARVNISVSPPFWLNRWFLLLLTVSIAGFYYYRSQRFSMRQQELLSYIKDKERAETELRRNKEIFDIISAGVDDYIMVMTMKGEFVYASSSVTRMIDINNKELTTLFGIIHPEDKRKALRSLADAIDIQNTTRIELRLVLPEAGIRFVEAQWNIIRDEHFQPFSVIIVARDTTERKKIEEEIILLNKNLEQKVETRTSELLSINDSLQLEIVERERKEEIERHRSEQLIGYRTKLLELSQIDKRNFSYALEQILGVASHSLCVERAGYWTLEESGRLLKCRKMFIRTLDGIYTEAETIELPATFPGKASSSETYLEALMHNKPLIAFNALDDPDSGIVEHYLLPNHISSMVDTPVWYRGKVIGILCLEQVGAQWAPTNEEEDYLTSLATMISLSIETEQRSIAERELRNSEEQYRILVENANESIIVAQDGVIKYANPRTLELIDYSIEELTSRPFLSFIYEEDREFVMNNYIARLRGEPTENNYYFRVIQKNGELRDIEINAVLIIWEGKPATLNFLTDVTKRKAAENELKHALEKEKELSELRSRFISMASHEFRTPLTSILTSTEIIEKFGERLDAVKRMNNLRRIKESVRLMTSLLNDVLIIGKSDAGKLECKPEKTDLRNFLNGLVEYAELSVFAGKETIRFVHSFTCEEAEVEFDVFLIRQVLENLLTNAVKYSPAGGVVTFSVHSTFERVVFAVRDTGIGIPTEDVLRIFEPFHRAKNVGTIQGTGLGLAIVHRAVKLHNGSVSVRSDMGGTEFTIEIPRLYSVYQDKQPQ